MSRLTPICVPCALQMRCVKNNRPVRDPATADFASTFWMGDEYECPKCSHRIITGFGTPIDSRPELERAEALMFAYEEDGCGDATCPYIGGQTTRSTEDGPAESFVWCEVCPGSGEAVFVERQHMFCTTREWRSCPFAQAEIERAAEAAP